jgi:type IV pilus assembly protein PilW
MNSSMPIPFARQRGLTLVELLVAMAIGLIVTLAVTSVVSVGEAHKRTTTSGNDMGQSGSFAAYALDRALRSAGSGFVQSANLGVFGCKLSVSRDIGGTATTILPRATAFAAPFAGFLGGAGATASGNLRVAPLLIGKSQSAAGSDVLAVMGGNAAAGDIPRPIRSEITGTNNLRLNNTVGLRDGDVGLVARDGSPDCLIEQVNVTDAAAFAAAGNEVLPLGGQYFTSTGSDTSLATLAASGSAYFTTLGNVGASNLQFQLIGVGANRTLFSYDLLRAAGTGSDADALQALADGVAELHALYGVDTNGDGIINGWVDPSGDYAIATLMTTPATMRQIVAVRVALVMRSANFEKEEVSPGSLILFNDLAAALRRTVTIGTEDRHYRYRVIDTIIPLRNMLLQSAS